VIDGRKYIYLSAKTIDLKFTTYLYTDSINNCSVKNDIVNGSLEL